jgi:hypothetical protein
MKAIIIKGVIQIVSEVPVFWKDKQIYEVVKHELRPDQKYGEVSDAVINEETRTITIPVLEMATEEYDAVLEKEGKELLEELKVVVSDLEEGAKKISIAKEGSKEYIEAQVRIYEKKYLIAKGELPDYLGLIESEALEVGVSFADYKALIINKYELGAGLFNSFSIMIDRSRIKTLVFVENKKNHKARMLLDLMKSIKTTTPVNEIQLTMSKIINIQ